MAGRGKTKVEEKPRWKICFNKDIELDSAANLIYDIQESVLDHGKIDLYFTSNGGDLSSSIILLETLNQYKDSINLIGYNTLQSCGFDLFWKFEGNKRLIEGTFAMIHKGDATCSLRKDPEGRRCISEFLESMDKKWDYIFLTKEQREVYERQEDVFLSYRELQTILNK